LGSVGVEPDLAAVTVTDPRLSKEIGTRKVPVALPPSGMSWTRKHQQCAQ
jgi:hypothetical protein